MLLHCRLRAHLFSSLDGKRLQLLIQRNSPFSSLFFSRYLSDKINTEFIIMIIPIASDHAGFEAKETTKNLLSEMGHTPVDFGTHSPDSVDYPDFAIQVAEKISSGEQEIGILICGSGQGMCMTANKLPNVRGALVYSPEVAELSRRHNNANILCLPGRDLNPDQIKEILEHWFSAGFEGGRHERRVKKIHSLTDKNQK